jgi:hypothetical protein
VRLDSESDPDSAEPEDDQLDEAYYMHWQHRRELYSSKRLK